MFHDETILLPIVYHGIRNVVGLVFRRGALARVVARSIVKASLHQHILGEPFGYLIVLAGEVDDYRAGQLFGIHGDCGKILLINILKQVSGVAAAENVEGSSSRFHG